MDTTHGDDHVAQLDAAFSRHRRAALALAQRVLGDAHLAEDAVQLAFVQIIVRVRGGDERLLRDDPRAVVLRSTRWAALKLVERDRDRHAAGELGDSAAAIDPWERADARLVSQDIVATLPPHYRAALLMRYVEDQPDDSGAARLALTVKAYRRRLDRALVLARSHAGRIGANTAGAVLGTLGLRRRAMALRAWHLRADARVRQARARLGQAAGGPGLNHWAVMVAIASVSAGVLLSPLVRPGAAGPQLSASTAAYGTSPSAAPQGAVQHLPPGAAATPAPGSAAPKGTPAPSPTAPSLLPIFNPPPPQQENIGEVVRAPEYDSNHVVLMAGAGYGCHCSPIYRSMDGGATWESSSIGVQGGQFVLPPAYPADPRILVDEGLLDSACIMAEFHASTCLPIPLFGPARFDSRFDSGVPVVYGFDPLFDVVLAYNVDTHLLSPIVLGQRGTVTDLLAAPPASGVGLYVVAETDDVSVDEGGIHAPGVVHSLFACSADLACRRTSLNTLGYYQNSTFIDPEDATGRSFAGIVGPDDAIRQQRVLGWTDDAGATFPVEISIPYTVEGAVVQPIGPAGDLALYEETFGPQGASPFERLFRWSLDGSRTELSMPFAASPSTQFDVVPLDRERLLGFLGVGNQLGYWCSADGGHTWARSCPPA